MSALAFAALLALGYFVGMVVTVYLITAFTGWGAEAHDLAVLWPLVPPLLLLDYAAAQGRKRRKARR